MVLDISKAKISERASKLSAAKGASVAPLQKVYAEDLHLLPSEIDEYIEDVVAWTEKKYGADEVIAAREEFFWKTGKVFDDDVFYHDRMTFFLDFFVFLRPIAKLMNADNDLTPFAAYKTIHTPGDTETRKSAPMSGVIYSLFEVLKANDFELIVQDCFTRDRHTVVARGEQKFRGISRKNIFQGCLYSLKENCAISLGCIFHQEETWRILRKLVKKSQKSSVMDIPRELSEFAKINLKSLRHPHVSPKRIYSELLKAPVYSSNGKSE